MNTDYNMLRAATQLISCVFMTRCIHVAEWWEQHYGGRKFGRQLPRLSISMRGLRMDSRGPEYSIIKYVYVLYSA